MPKHYLSTTKPGAGKYRCIVCGYEITLADGEMLPVCPMCGCEQYTKLA